MRPRRLVEASAPSVRPSIGGRSIPSLPIPDHDDLATVEEAARRYGQEHAATVGVSASRLAVAAFRALAHRGGLIAGPVDPERPFGRWRSHPPRPGVSAALARLSGGPSHLAEQRRERTEEGDRAAIAKANASRTPSTDPHPSERLP